MTENATGADNQDMARRSFDFEAFAAARRATGKTQKQFAKEVNCARGTLSRVETGKQMPGAFLARVITEAVGKPAGSFLSGSGVAERTVSEESRPPGRDALEWELFSLVRELPERFVERLIGTAQALLVQALHPDAGRVRPPLAADTTSGLAAERDADAQKDEASGESPTG